MNRYTVCAFVAVVDCFDNILYRLPHSLSPHTLQYLYHTGGRGSRRNSRAGPRGATRGGGPSNHQEPTYRYENDFDFESANAQFNKQVLEEEFKRLRVSGKARDGGTTGSVSDDMVGGEEVEEEIEEIEEGEIVEEPDPEQFYDKSKSFFDNISCENSGSGGNR